MPLENEEELRFILMKKKQREQHEQDRIIEEDEKQKRHVKELERQTRAASSKNTNVLDLLTQGGYAFDSSGKPLLVRKVNPTRLPEIVSGMGIDIDGQTVCKIFEGQDEATEAPNLIRQSNSTKRIVTQPTLSRSETGETLIPRLSSQVRVRPVTAKA